MFTYTIVIIIIFTSTCDILNFSISYFHVSSIRHTSSYNRSNRKIFIIFIGCFYYLYFSLFIIIFRFFCSCSPSINLQISNDIRIYFHLKFYLFLFFSGLLLYLNLTRKARLFLQLVVNGFHLLLFKSIDILIFCRQDPDCYAQDMFCQIILIYQYFWIFIFYSLTSNMGTFLFDNLQILTFMYTVI